MVKVGKSTFRKRRTVSFLVGKNTCTCVHTHIHTHTHRKKLSEKSDQFKKFILKIVLRNTCDFPRSFTIAPGPKFRDRKLSSNKHSGGGGVPTGINYASIYLYLHLQ